ncbi:MAG: DUF362 domain-containing protein [Acidobacteria bacterium]|jgi:uncharacterized protein (DUF362 family)|nr:DUF362 domain-containing protein [Acidobacteriota bacterium]
MAAPRVVVVRSSRAWTAAGAPDPGVVAAMLGRGFARLTGRADPAAAVASLFSPADRVGIKINAIGGKALSTRPEVAMTLAAWLLQGGVPGRNIVVWDRTRRELRDAGYAIGEGRYGVRVLGTDDPDQGYGPDLVAHLGVGSLFSRVLTGECTASISLALLKDHGLAGLTAGMKNYFGAVHNPNKYHDGGCDPHVAEVFDAPPVRSRHRLTVLDALTVQFHKGPSFHARWAAKYGGFVLGLDPVAVDTVGWSIVEGLRAEAGLPSLEAEGRAPRYLATAARMGLGTADPAAIERLEESVT